jgi:hypothetical protein
MDMLLHRRLLVLVVGAALAMALAFTLPNATKAAPPEPQQPATLTIEGACDFPVLLEQMGHFRFIDVPGEDFMLVFPPAGGSGILTNVNEPENQVTVRGGGMGRVTPLANGDWLVNVSGHNVLIVPGEGIFEVRRATFTLAPPYDIGSELTILESKGKVIDICALLA